MVDVGSDSAASAPFRRASSFSTGVRLSRAKSPTNTVRSAPLGSRLTCGKARSTSRARLSETARSKPVCRLSRKYSPAGLAASISPSKWARPWLRTTVSGSSPSGRNTKRNSRCSDNAGNAASMALLAARMPASSPSKQQVTRFTCRYRRLKCASPMAVPNAATALAMPCSAQRHHVHVAFHQNDAVESALVSGLEQAIQFVAFLEHRRFRRIEILRLAFPRAFAFRPAAVVESPAEADDAAARVSDGEHDALAEAVVGSALIVLREQAGGEQLALAERRKRHLQAIPARGREADAEIPHGLAAQARLLR